MDFAHPQFVDIAGRRLAYEEVRPDRPEGTVLLLCGIGAKRQGWYKQLPVLGERFRALALDYRDVGEGFRQAVKRAGCKRQESSRSTRSVTASPRC